MILGDLGKFWGKIEIETYMIQSNQSAKKIIVQNLSWRIFFQEQLIFLTSGIWFQFYNASNENAFFLLTRYILFNKIFIKADDTV